MDPHAVDMAMARLALYPSVEVRQLWVPEQWPTEMFDLIVLSEFGFYLTAADLEALACKTIASLNPGGTVVVCHWRRR